MVDVKDSFCYGSAEGRQVALLGKRGVTLLTAHLASLYGAESIKKVIGVPTPFCFWKNPEPDELLSAE